MKSPALVAVDDAPERFAALFAAAAERGVRVGWLELSSTAPPPPPLADAAASGVAKAVAVGTEGAVAWKRRRGAPVLRDLVREHFLGFAVVLVRGGEGRPRLVAAGDGFRFEPVAGAVRLLPAAELLAELLRPRHRG